MADPSSQVTHIHAYMHTCVHSNANANKSVLYISCSRSTSITSSSRSSSSLFDQSLVVVVISHFQPAVSTSCVYPPARLLVGPANSPSPAQPRSVLPLPTRIFTRGWPLLHLPARRRLRCLLICPRPPKIMILHVSCFLPRWFSRSLKMEQRPRLNPKKHHQGHGIADQLPTRVLAFQTERTLALDDYTTDYRRLPLHVKYQRIRYRWHHIH